MQETGEEGHEPGLIERLLRMEQELRSQRIEMETLRTEVLQLKSQTAAGNSPAIQDYAAPLRNAEPPFAPSTPVVQVPPPPERVVQTSVPPPIQPSISTPPVTAPLPPRPIAPEFVAQAPPEQTPLVVQNLFSEPAQSSARPEVRRSVENRIGSVWFPRIGILAILVAVALALKYAYDNHWIHPTAMGKIISGLLLGAAVVLWSERFRRKGYDAFSFSLKAIGTGTLYLTLWASFQMYHKLPASVALCMMIGVTAWNATMAWAQDSELLAVYALVGGFATPALLGSGGNHQVFLFSYVLAMDVAVLFLASKKPWQRLLLGSFPGTVIYFVAWYSEFFTPDQASVTGLFAVLLAAPFAVVALIGKQRDDATEGVLAPFAAASFLAGSLYPVLEDSHHHAWLPWFAVALAAVYLLLMRVRREGVAEAMHLALAIIFLTIAIPLKAEGRWITIGWLAEGVVLLWVAAKLLGPDVQSRVRGLMRWLGCGALALGVCESLVFWTQQDAQNSFWNARFATEMSAVAALALAAWLARHPRNEGEAVRRAPGWTVIAVMSALVSHILAPLAVARELTAFWSVGASADAAYRVQLNAFSIAAFLMVYGACLMAWVAVREKSDFARLRTTLRVLGGLYLVLGSWTMIVTPIVGDGGPLNVFWNARLLLEMAGAATLAATAWLAWRAWRVRKIADEQWPGTAAVCLVTFNLITVLAGVHEISTYFGTHAPEDAILVEAFSISAWLMVYAAVLLAAGFWRRMAFVRWQGLALLVFTIGKVFLYDMHTLSSGYRILSVFGLGALLMTVSFAYQKDWLRLREDSVEPDEVAP